MIPCSAMVASSIPRLPRRPPCTFGCRVFTRPSIISVEPVYAETSVNAIPASFRTVPVPPEESIFTPCFPSARASSRIPCLSHTERSAHFMVRVLETIPYECDAAKQEDELNGTRSAGHGWSGAHEKQGDESALHSQSDRGVSRRYRKR
ncbi:hypothetical protein ASZ90_016607 [hydrocarbon metagenome]|uniref:Uncharacterized protein n=1 Tax=hydrocarbon metagenome TaxID=938273 RepID=A0A0W8EMU8_9ZZZZ